MPLPRLEHLVATHPLETTTAWYAVDASVWPRCDAETSASTGLLPSFHSPVPWPAHRRGLELLLAGSAPRTLLQLDRAARGCGASSREKMSKRLAAEQIRSF